MFDPLLEVIVRSILWPETILVYRNKRTDPGASATVIPLCLFGIAMQLILAKGMWAGPGFFNSQAWVMSGFFYLLAGIFAGYTWYTKLR